MTTLSLFFPGSSARTLDVVVVDEGLRREVEHQPGVAASSWPSAWVMPTTGTSRAKVFPSVPASGPGALL